MAHKSTSFHRHITGPYAYMGKFSDMKAAATELFGKEPKESPYKLEKQKKDLAFGKTASGIVLVQS